MKSISWPAINERNDIGEADNGEKLANMALQ